MLFLSCFLFQQAFPGSHVAMTISMTLVTLGILVLISHTVTVLLLLGIVFITFICPAWLISLQSFKK